MGREETLPVAISLVPSVVIGLKSVLIGPFRSTIHALGSATRFGGATCFALLASGVNVALVQHKSVATLCQHEKPRVFWDVELPHQVCCDNVGHAMCQGPPRVQCLCVQYIAWDRAQGCHQLSGTEVAPVGIDFLSSQGRTSTQVYLA